MQKLSIVQHLFVLFIIVFSIPLNAQPIQWNSRPSKGFVFQITNKEAENLLTGGVIDEKLLHTLVDTFNVDKGWLTKPEKGHFILATINKNKLHCEYTCVFPYQVFLMKEYNALALQVLDKEGNVREDAMVKMHWKRIRFDTKSNSYRVDNQYYGGKDKNVTVELDGFRSVFNIVTHEVPYWENNYNYDDGPDFYSYLITDKNKYKPNDKVQFKSYALNASKFPMRKELEVWLNGSGKRIKVGTVLPHRPGSYAGEFYLADSLKLTLDRNYNLILKDNHGRYVSTCSFRYEDYELFGNKLDVKLATTEHYNPDTNCISIKATDANGLMLKDAKAEVTVKTVSILKAFTPFVSLNDTLMHVKLDLDTEEPTVIDILPGIFKQTNTVYQVEVIVLNSENERNSQRYTAYFYNSKYDIIPHYQDDSICFEFYKNGIPQSNVPAKLSFDNLTDTQQITLPYKAKINASLRSISLSNQWCNNQFAMQQYTPYVDVDGGIVQDSFVVSLQNEQKLDVSYFIYQGTVLLERGSGSEMDYHSLITDRYNTYYVEVFYSYGGRENVKRYKYEFADDKLDISLDMPDRVYPGQTVNGTITVTDQLGNPVKGVDLTAWSITSKLNYYVPDLPYYGEVSKPRSKQDSYSKHDLQVRSMIFDLKYDKWKEMASLDTMKYYQFTYPRNKAFVYEYPINDSTQFAPFAMSEGNALKVYVVELNHQPVYFSWTKQPDHYSFYVDPAKKYEVSLRLIDRVIVLDSMQFTRGNKTIFSVDIDQLPPKSKTYKLSEITSAERLRYRRYISSFKNTYSDYAYLETPKGYIPLFGDPDVYTSYNSYVLAGPVPEGKIRFTTGGTYEIAYKHENGFSYSFDGNVVYKETEQIFSVPKYFSNKWTDPMPLLNDLVLTRVEFIEKSKWKPKVFDEPYSSVINLASEQKRLNISLPLYNEAKGMPAILFQSCLTDSITYPGYKLGMARSFYFLPDGVFNVIALYNDASYQKIANLEFKPNTCSSIQFSLEPYIAADSLSQHWAAVIYKNKLNNYNGSFKSVKEARNVNQPFIYANSATGNVTGAVYDENNEPVIGATIIVKGTTKGTITDLDGQFALDIDDYSATLIVSFIGYVTEEVNVTIGSNINVSLTEDICGLDEIVVVGYGMQRKSDITGSVAVIQGRMAGISVTADEEETETVAPEDEAEEKKKAEEQLYRELMTLKNIRSNFSDVGFWEPRLYTDRNGKSEFTTTFPDDITQWKAVVYGMDRYLHTGTARKDIKSYKPIMAELHVPRFLVEGDSVALLGKVLNYSSDSSLTGQLNWKVGNDSISKTVAFQDYATDKFSVEPQNLDSITAQFSFTRNDGYFDGEQRQIPIFEQGIERAEGELRVIQTGDSLAFVAPENTSLTISLLDNQLSFYSQQARYLIQYKYACNEQLASKLIGLISLKRQCAYNNEKFKYDRVVGKIIDKLLKNQNDEFLWSWWNCTPNTSYWISAHVLRALKYAQDAGYAVNLDVANIVRKATYRFDLYQQFSVNDIDLLNALSQWNADLNYKYYVSVLDTLLESREREYSYYRSPYALKERFLLEEVKLMQHMDYQRDTILKYKKVGVMGEIFFDDHRNNYWFYDRLGIDLIAYRIIKQDSALSYLKLPAQMGFIKSYSQNRWNTYESSNVLMNVLPDLMDINSGGQNKAGIRLTGKTDTLIQHFPYEINLEPGEHLNLKQVSGLPMYCQNYITERVTEAKTGREGFTISSRLNQNGLMVKAGQPVQLLVDVELTKDSKYEYVMIEIPIPASCSYGSKDRSIYQETHREYFKDRVVVFCQNLDKGKYTFKVNLLPRFTGTFNLNPSQISLMYVPVINANTDLKKIVIND